MFQAARKQRGQATQHRQLRHQFAAAFTALCLLAGVTCRADYTVSPNPTVTWGTWDGWGCALCWWAGVFGQRDDLANIVFGTNYVSFNGETLPGLGLNIVRYNAGACSTNSIGGATMVVSPNISAYRQMPGYWFDWSSSDPGSSSWNWQADANQRAMLLKARARGANLYELFSNSPMWWMCYNHNPSGADSGSSDNLQSWNYDQAALYLATIAAYAATNWGLQFNSVEAFNEPISTWWTSQGTQEGCHFAASTQATVIGYLRSELDSRGLTNTVVSASDENTYDQAISTWQSFSSAVQAQVGRVNVHGYQYGGGRRDLLYNAVAGKKLWLSEYGEADASGMSLVSNLNLDFAWLHMTGWCYWQPFDSGGWGLIASNPGQNWIGSSNPKYFVLAQYTRHIRPGMTIVNTGDGNSVAAYDPAARKLVIVTVNYSAAQNIQFDLSQFPYAAGPVKRWMTTPGTSVKYQLQPAISVVNRAFTSAFNTNTIQTFEIANVDAAAPPAPGGVKALGGIGQVALQWSSATGAVNYLVTRATGLSGPFQSLATVTTTNYSDLAVSPGLTYFYQVTPANGAGTGAASATVQAMPLAPPSLSAQPSSAAGQIVLSWPDWATNFSLYYTTRLTSPIQWQLLSTPLLHTNNTWLVNLSPTNQLQEYFRLASP